jgi:hypothetical protein
MRRYAQRNFDRVTVFRGGASHSLEGSAYLIMQSGFLDPAANDNTWHGHGSESALQNGDPKLTTIPSIN